MAICRQHAVPEGLTLADGKIFYILGICSVDKKIMLLCQQDFPYRVVFSAGLDTGSADTKAETLSTVQK